MSGSESTSSTLASVLRERARTEPDRVVYTHLRDGETDEVSLSFAQLWARSRALAEVLRARALVDQRVLLLYPPGLDYAEALFACFIAGVIAVPEGPPDPRRPERNMARIRAVARDARIAAVLTVAATLPARAVDPAAFADAEWIATDALDELDGLDRRELAEPELPPADALAYLQYTSGSTANPRGVMLSHRNLAANCAAIEETYATGRDSVMVSWVPTFHDLGLVYGVAMPVWSGFRGVSLAAADFARRPLRWLQAIDRYRGTHSIAPDGAYAITASKARLDDAGPIDLSCWETALNGAEPIRASTQRRFVAAFAPAGFRAEAFSHSWGLSEATAMLTGERSGRRTEFLRVDADALARHELAPATPSSARVIELASCGTPASGTRLAIVDPDTRSPTPAGRVGEVWVRGPSVGRGYFGAPEASAETFAATTADGEGPWMRTGDRGFIDDGRLFIAGRIKELLIIRGQNHYPHDLEASVAGRHRALRPAGCVAFSIDGDDGEQVVIVAEVRPELLDDPEPVRGAIRAGLADHGLSPACVALVAPGVVPRTSSGKLQRGKTRALLLDGALATLDLWRAPVASPSLAAGERPSASASVDEVRREVAELLGVGAADIDPDRPLAELGLDSITLASLAERLSARWGRPLTTTELFDHPSPRALAAWRDGAPRPTASASPFAVAEIRAKLARVDVEALAAAPWIAAFMALPDAGAAASAKPDEVDEQALFELAAQMLGRG